MTPMSVSERIAVSICWLSRQPAMTPGTKPTRVPGRMGLPNSPTLRLAVADRHETTCGWCDYPDLELIRMAGRIGTTDQGVEVLSDEERSFARLPRNVQRELVVTAQSKELDLV